MRQAVYFISSRDHVLLELDCGGQGAATQLAGEQLEAVGSDVASHLLVAVKFLPHKVALFIITT